MVQILKRAALLAGCVVFLTGVAGTLSAAEPDFADENVGVETNVNRLQSLVSGSECVGGAVDLDGVVLWVGSGRDQLVLQTATGALRVKMDLDSQPAVASGQHIRLSGYGVAGQGILDEALVDNDGLHGITEKSASIYLKAGLHPICAGWFNGLADFLFTVQYAGPQVKRGPIPGNVLFRTVISKTNNTTHLVPGLDYSVYEGNWEWLPHWPALTPVKTGITPNFNLGVRSRDENVGIQFRGCIRIDHDGIYTFWTKSDDGSRLFIGNNPLHIEVLGSLPLPVPRKIEPGQTLALNDDCFWAQTEGVVVGIHTDPGGISQVLLSAGANRMYVELNATNARPPALFSRIRVTGVCRNTPVTGGGGGAGRLLVSSADQVEELTPAPAPEERRVTTVEKLRQLSVSGQRTAGSLRLSGMVMATNSQAGLFAFQDDTGGIFVQMDGYGEALRPGDEVVLTGNGVLDGNTLLLDNAAIVDNNGIHSRQQRNGTMFLQAGLHPLHLSWFNRGSVGLLDVYYQGPKLARQKIPASALVHPEFDVTGQDVKWVPGLDYECYEGDWQDVPKLARIDPVERGTIANFETRVTRRVEKTGLEFDGYLKVLRDGLYFFSVTSDDGSLFFIDEEAPRAETTGTGEVPAPLAIKPRQVLGPDQNNRWAEAEGTVNFAYERAGSLFLELSSDYGPLSVYAVNGAGSSPLLLLGSRVKVDGFCQSVHMPDGQEVAASMTTLGMEQIQLLETPAAQWGRYPLMPIKDVPAKISPPDNEVIVHVRGEIGRKDGGRRIFLTDKTGTIEVVTAQPLPEGLSGTVDLIGRLGQAGTNIRLQCAIYRPATDRPMADPKKLMLLTTAQQVKQLTREQAQQGYPVKIRGVITLVRNNGSGFIIQDDTSAIDVWWQSSADTSLPRIGDYWEVEGQTFAEFAPNIRSSRAIRLGAGTMPEPLHPAWDQLLNGSLDTRYVELQGIVTAVEADGVTLLTRSGKIHVLLTQPPETLKHYGNALVRIRGCVVPIRNQVSQQVQVGEIRLTSVSLSMDEPPPTDPFEAGLKHASELLQFDARAGSLQRVKIIGQVLYNQGSQFFLVDDTNAVRVLPQQPASLQAGDRVEVVGFPELGGPSPVLREALVRQTGHAPVPPAKWISGDALFAQGHDGSLVTVDARLIGASGNHREKLLELQAGNREFMARLDGRYGPLEDLVTGSLLELTGVYSEQGGGQAAGQPLTAFELLLNSPQDVKVLERPPWLTLQRALIFAGGLALVILGGTYWIILLRRRIEEHSQLLALEVQRREQIQQQNALERERTRIAKDMHDQLGTSVTQVGLLAELTKKNANDPQKIASHAAKIGETVFELSRTLDEIVWAVNPKNDSLDKFCDYIAVQAQELFQLTDILCRVDLPPEMPRYPLSAEMRHNLFLAAKEALNNVARHSGAREVWVRFKLEGGIFEIAITDDGRGFEVEPKHALRNGMQNMRKRLEDAGGQFAVASQPGGGTRVTLGITLTLPVETALKQLPKR